MKSMSEHSTGSITTHTLIFRRWYGVMLASEEVSQFASLTDSPNLHLHVGYLYLPKSRRTVETAHLVVCSRAQTILGGKLFDLAALDNHLTRLRIPTDRLGLHSQQSAAAETMAAD